MYSRCNEKVVIVRRNDEAISWQGLLLSSADFNDLTEVALCKILGQKPFKTISGQDINFKGYIAHKIYRKEAGRVFPETAFYVREKADDTSDSRGFIIQEGAALRKQLMEEHAYPGGQEISGVRRLLGQLVVAKNPFLEGKWIVIISGISGPATLGIAQLLTGCMYKEFTINNLQPTTEEERMRLEEPISKYKRIVTNEVLPQKDDVGKVPYDALSEHMLNKLLTVAERSSGEVNALVEVEVCYPPRSGSSYSNDERKVIGWSFPNLTEFLGKSWMNPNNLKCHY